MTSTSINHPVHVTLKQQKSTYTQKLKKKWFTYTLIKLSSLSTSDEALAVWIPGYTGKAVFMGLWHFSPQLPRLVQKVICKDVFNMHREK